MKALYRRASTDNAIGARTICFVASKLSILLLFLCSFLQSREVNHISNQMFPNLGSAKLNPDSFIC